jgi:hypothetical protein
MDVLRNLEEVKQSVNELFYNSSSIELMCNNRAKLKHAIEVLENSISTTKQQDVNCSAKECIYCKEGKCIAKEISMEDVEQNENIKFLDGDYMACKTFKAKEY